MFKYTLIISQYYHSYHQFIVKYEDEKFLEKATELAVELMKYKRDDDSEETYLGDLSPKYRYNSDGEIRRRYNINDAGDIYLINHCSIESVVYDLKLHDRDCIRFSKGYKRKEVVDAINTHHEYKRVKEIVEKYFEII